MGYAERLVLYDKLEKALGYPVISYITSSRPNASGEMASDVVPEFARQLLCIPVEKKKVGLLIVSYGGDPTVAWRIVTMLRERFDEITVLLPFSAYSSATLLALGANTILMHPFSNLGPVDPQLTYVRRVPGQPGQKDMTENIRFGSEDLRHFLDFVRSDAGISDQEQMERALELVCKDVGAIPIGVSKRGSYLALSMGEKLLSMHMEDHNKAKSIAETLNKSFYHHGYPLSRTEAKDIGLPVEQPNAEIEELMWQTWEDMEKEMQCSVPFNPLHIVLNSSQGASLAVPVTQHQLPVNLPVQIMQQVISNLLQQIPVVEVAPVNYEIFFASVESIHCRSEYKIKGMIYATRLPDMNISLNLAETYKQWDHFRESKENGA
jgi:hypothetical protein